MRRIGLYIVSFLFVTGCSEVLNIGSQNKASVGQPCSAPSDCASAVCTGGACAPAVTCSNGVRDADRGETDVDCGGQACLACPNGKKCQTFRDCLSQICSGSGVDAFCTATVVTDATGVADMTVVPPADMTGADLSGDLVPPAPSCTDGIKNQDESDIDCGGTICGKCANGKTCSSFSDCLSSTCAMGVCAGVIPPPVDMTGPADMSSPADMTSPPDLLGPPDLTPACANGVPNPCPDDSACIEWGHCASGVCGFGKCIANPTDMGFPPDLTSSPDTAVPPDMTVAPDMASADMVALPDSVSQPDTVAMSDMIVPPSDLIGSDLVCGAPVGSCATSSTGLCIEATAALRATCGGCQLKITTWGPAGVQYTSNANEPLQVATDSGWAGYIRFNTICGSVYKSDWAPSFSGACPAGFATVKYNGVDLCNKSQLCPVNGNNMPTILKDVAVCP